MPALKKVLAVYPQAKVKPVTGGVLLLGSAPLSPTRAGRPSNANLLKCPGNVSLNRP